MYKAIELLQRCVNAICIFLLLFAFVTILFHIIGRYVFTYPLFFAEEISRYCFIWAVMLGAGIGLRRKAHTRVEYFVNFLSDRNKAVLEIIVDLGIIGFLGFVVYYGFFLVNKTMSIPTAAMEWPWGLIYSAAPIGAILMIITNIYHVVAGIRGLQTTRASNE